MSVRTGRKGGKGRRTLFKHLNPISLTKPKIFSLSGFEVVKGGRVAQTSRDGCGRGSCCKRRGGRGGGVGRGGDGRRSGRGRGGIVEEVAR